MNKQTIITAMLALVAMAGQGQTIKRVEASLEDFMEHMAMYGYEVFTYDISSFKVPLHWLLSHSVGLHRDHHPAFVSQ